MRERTIRYFAYLAADADKAAALCWLRGGSGGVAGEGGGRIAIGDRTPQRTLRLQQSIHQEHARRKSTCILQVAKRACRSGWPC